MGGAAAPSERFATGHPRQCRFSPAGGGSQHFASAGVEGSRIRFVARQPMEDYFAQYGQIDLALDPFPYGGGTTTCDALVDGRSGGNAGGSNRGGAGAA